MHGNSNIKLSCVRTLEFSYAFLLICSPSQDAQQKLHERPVFIYIITFYYILGFLLLYSRLWISDYTSLSPTNQ